MTKQIEYGDFQTPRALADAVVDCLDRQYGAPERVVEPTAGTGTFLQAAVTRWGNSVQYEGYEINPDYISAASEKLKNANVKLHQKDFFSSDWTEVLSREPGERLLVLGNPPWVTNAVLGALGSSNLPKKSNFQALRGFEAKTGKSNFDIAEWILIKLFDALPRDGRISMLCKTATARKVLRHFWKTSTAVLDANLCLIDAKAHFGVAVDACLFTISGDGKKKTAPVYADLTQGSIASEIGFIAGQMVADIEAYEDLKDIDGGSPYIWRSGIKHDASQIMEFTNEGRFLRNGLGEMVDIEPDYVYPLLKSSDLGNRRTSHSRSVLVTQRKPSDATERIKDVAPKTWKYLEAHASALDARRSSIYLNRPKFCVFGVGEYSFLPWKVAISGLYKNLNFSVISPFGDRPVMLDDTCYFVGCNSQSEADLLCQLLNSVACQNFLRAVVFEDAKRPVTIEILRRISLAGLANRFGVAHELTHCIHATAQQFRGVLDEVQMNLMMESSAKYRKSRKV